MQYSHLKKGFLVKKFSVCATKMLKYVLHLCNACKLSSFILLLYLTFYDLKKHMYICVCVHWHVCACVYMFGYSSVFVRMS